MIDKIGQLLFIGIRGKSLSQEESEFIVKNNIGGVILFARNIESPMQVHALCQEIQATRHKTRDKLPLFIGVDQEGGRVARMKPPFTLWPPLGKVGAIDSTSVAFKFALCMGAELRAVGINTDFAPCVDVYTNPKNEIIGDRALSTDPEQVAKLASALVRGYIKAGIIPCAKHFPGHGNTLADSHEELPIETVDRARLESIELIPFKKVFRARLDMVMTAHIKFSQIDPDWPVTMSEKFLRQMLRQELRYRGLVISDDLDMRALAAHYSVPEIALRSFQAGCDILLYCNKFDHPQIAIDTLMQALKDQKITAQQIDESYNRVVLVKKDMLTHPDPLPLAKANEVVGNELHQRLSDAIRSGTVPADLLT